MVDPRSHHYVPQFLLRNFALDNARRRIRMYRIEAREHVAEASIKGQCAENYLYGCGGSQA